MHASAIKLGGQALCSQEKIYCFLSFLLTGEASGRPSDLGSQLAVFFVLGYNTNQQESLRGEGKNPDRRRRQTDCPDAGI